tara:strand:+ start:1336 stop:1719 length:384 start_codon:yes stop_codon:yes gene_type:complete
VVIFFAYYYSITKITKVILGLRNSYKTQTEFYAFTDIQRRMIHVEAGNTTSEVYCEIPSLTNWSITLIAKDGRETISTTTSMSVNQKASRRYYLDWTVPTLKVIEYDYEIYSDTLLIEKGILRNGVV